MLRHLYFFIIAIMCCFPTAVFSSQSVRVVVLPFEIHSLEEISYLKTEIPRVIKKHLKQEGAIILELDIKDDSLLKKRVQSTAGIRNIGIQTGADFVVCGSLTWIGKKFSMDAKVIDSYGEQPPHTIFVEGKGIENLPGTVKELTDNIGTKLFKREKIVSIEVTGNNRIEVDAIKRKIKTATGDIYLLKALSEDLKALYSMGYFEDIRIEAETVPEGKIIVFNVKEKSTVRIIRIIGNRAIKDEKIKENLDIKTGSILNIFKINSNIKRIEELYKDKNYHNVNVSYQIDELENNQADLEFVIEEGKKLRIKKIEFKGNIAYTDKKLKKLIKTSEKGFFYWLTSSGELAKEDLNQDISKLSSFYHNNGFIHARIGEPNVEFKDNSISITIKISEGPRFKFGKVDIEGDIVLSKEELLKKLKITKEEFYSREIIRNDVLTLTDLYSDEGYAYADISPRIDQDAEKSKVDIIYVIKKGKLVYFEKIIIDGNTKTRDKIVRRELKVYEQELYSGRRLKRSVRNLYRLDFFEDIKVNTSKGSSDDKMILNLDVMEKPTGSLTFGGGYSSVENLFVTGSVSQKNLFGRAQVLALKAMIGGTTQQFTLSFTEPWLFDIPLSAGIDLYNWDYDYDTYDKNSVGSKLRFGYKVFDFTRAYLYYNYDIADIKNIDEDEASESVKDLEGVNITSSITTKLRYDSRDSAFNPTEGSDHSLSIEHAGGPLGGDMAFTKYMVDTGWYIPLFWSTTGFLHGRIGYVKENTDGKLPDYERFYLGGMNSLRGFDWRDIHVIDENGDEIGGDKFVQFNIEYIIPLFKKAGIVGVIFYDTGNVFGKDADLDPGNLRESAGGGFRWYSPIGPMRIEYGYILNPEEGEDSEGRWEFTMGQAF